MRRCQQCGVNKKNGAFKPENKTCERCLTNTKRWWRENEERCYRITIKSQYGLSSEDYDMMLWEQRHVCAICKQSCKLRKRLSVDHCHETNTVRGLLCDRCNKTLGLMKDSPDHLEAAAKYLRFNQVEV